MKCTFLKILQKQRYLVVPHLYFFCLLGIFASTNACMKLLYAILLFGEEPLFKHKVPAVRRYKMCCGWKKNVSSDFSSLPSRHSFKILLVICSTVHIYARKEKWNFLRALCINNEPLNQWWVVFLRGQYCDWCCLTSLLVTWTVGLSAPLASLPTIPSYMVRSTH